MLKASPTKYDEEAEKNLHNTDRNHGNMKKKVEIIANTDYILNTYNDYFTNVSHFVITH